MSVKERVELCRLLNKVSENPAFAEGVGIKDKTRFQKEKTVAKKKH